MGCLLTGFHMLLRDEERLKDFLKAHGFIDLMDDMNCPKCNQSCKYYPSYFKFMCSNRIAVSNRRKRKICGFVK